MTSKRIVSSNKSILSLSYICLKPYAIVDKNHTTLSLSARVCFNLLNDPFHTHLVSFLTTKINIDGVNQAEKRRQKFHVNQRELYYILILLHVHDYFNHGKFFRAL